LPLELQGRADARSLATEMLRRVGLSERLRHYPRVLSGGEQQRVALARAFVVRPALLLADEPTGSLDFATGETVMALMLELNREAGTTLVLVTHDPALAARCDHQLRIEAGRVSVDAPALG
jgi:putative ABC transport system ATP-binding protein